MIPPSPNSSDLTPMQSKAIVAYQTWWFQWQQENSDIDSEHTGLQAYLAGYVAGINHAADVIGEAKGDSP